MTVLAGSYPYQVPIDAYGGGGFRFADMSHKGSLLCLPSGVTAWAPVAAGALVLADFCAVFADPGRISFLLLGTGSEHVVPPSEICAAFAAAGIGLEPMTTGSAARTYNIMLAERRKVAAALIAVQ